MKLLLTSGGLRNPTLIKALIELVDKPADTIRVAFIPTAMNTESGDKGWAIFQMTRLQEIGIAKLDIVDISAIPRKIWLPRLEESDVIFVNGGNTTHLMECFNESGLTKELPKLLESRVYIGVSAGSYIATPDTHMNNDNTNKVLPGLRFVEFGLQAHYKSETFPLAKTYDDVKQRVEGCPYTIYALDDQMAAKIDGDKLTIVGEGECVEFSPS
ncbi:MAG TPA: Type 1 glutamine amidotransferase-like domain-containing protein [Patescibacteria group bacterium]|nr:Type 1 glutamine amidotransferase-like domain-containing protein [Patescibacteria group bacterium]